MSGCGARMEPIGLTFKKDGELMIVHQCLNCGKISPNRIAGDDNTYIICSLLDKSTDSKVKNLIGPDHKNQVLDCLYGKDNY
jgi:uncharacterized Zn finger protein